MKKKTVLDDYYDFFQELPQPDLSTDYLNDIEIQDEYESPITPAGLSDEQVSQLAQDSLGKNPQNNPPDRSTPSQK